MIFWKKESTKNFKFRYLLKSNTTSLDKVIEKDSNIEKYEDIKTSTLYKNCYREGQERINDLCKWGYFGITCHKKNRMLPRFEASFILAHTTDLVLTAHVRRFGDKMKIGYKEETIYALGRQTPAGTISHYEAETDRGCYPTEELSNHDFPAFPE